jgi:hypothetical protein
MTKVKLYKLLESKGINSCEVRLPGCTNNIYLTPAHRHKRLWYKHQPELLWQPSQVIIACQNCHQRIEYDR